MSRWTEQQKAELLARCPLPWGLGEETSFNCQILAADGTIVCYAQSSMATISFPTSILAGALVDYVNREWAETKETNNG